MTLITVTALLWPIVSGADSFPLSTYPMYATARPRQGSLVTAVGLDDQGREIRLSLALIGSTDDPLIAESLLRTAVRQERTGRLCTEIAARTARDAQRHEVIDIVVLTELLDLVDLVAGTAPPSERTVHATCAVRR